LVSGGNLITLQSSLATASEYKPKGTIVLLEDIGERGYRVDRVLEHFAQAGLWNGVRAIVFGDFTGGRDPDGKDRVPAVMQRFADQMRIPVLKGLRTGHGAVQRPVPFLTSATLNLGRRASLVVESGARLS
jgi:muramoyltetrapeptide carboxypeptidase